MTAIAMTSENQTSRSRLIGSWIMSGIVILFMVMDSLGKFFKPTEVIDGTLALGFQEHHIAPIGILGLASILLYSFRKTSILGAILLTGYYGGAIATHLRLDNPLFSHLLFPVYLAILAWGGLWLRDKRVRDMFSLQ